jgi:SAM-dependent methyltransferase
MLALDAGGSFLDLGCGSGVLGIAAAKLGWAPVVAVDNDPAAVAAARANATVNEVEVDVRRLDLRVEPAPAAATVAANLLGPLLVEWAATLGAWRSTRPRDRRRPAGCRSRSGPRQVHCPRAAREESARTRWMGGAGTRAAWISLRASGAGAAMLS